MAESHQHVGRLRRLLPSSFFIKTPISISFRPPPRDMSLAHVDGRNERPQQKA